jgi:protein-S-isoprenylcysteine O-methyltransferase Ste14
LLLKDGVKAALMANTQARVVSVSFIFLLTLGVVLCYVEGVQGVHKERYFIEKALNRYTNFCARVSRQNGA